MRLIAIGRLRDGPEAALFGRYVARIRPRLDLTELAEARGPVAEIKRREGAALLAALPAGAWAVALDQGGTQHASGAYATLLERWLADQRPLGFLIGGAEGLDAAVIERADHLLSLGAMTWPHLLARVMLAEQIWRARAITAGHPYHRSGRP